MNHESHIDLNADVGERPPALREGTEEKLLSLVTSANIACGGHAGDAETMAVVLAMCKRYGVAAGAHPGFPDRANFGRIEMPMTASELAGCVFEQVRTLARIAQQQHGELQHVKPHGALYNVAVHNKRIAEAIALGVARWSRELIMVGLANSAMLAVWQAMGFHVAAEAFVDRAYAADGTLRARTNDDALIDSPKLAGMQALRIIKEHCVTAVGGKVIRLQADTLCIHSDTPNAMAILAHLREQLQREGVSVSSLAQGKPSNL